MDTYVIGDRTLTCVDCGREVALTVEEQRFHRGMGFADSLRCPACQSARRARYRPGHRPRRSNRHEVPRERPRGSARLGHRDHVDPAAPTAAVANAIAVQEIFDPSSPGPAIGAVTADGTVLGVPAADDILAPGLPLCEVDASIAIEQTRRRERQRGLRRSRGRRDPASPRAVRPPGAAVTIVRAW